MSAPRLRPRTVRGRLVIFQVVVLALAALVVDVAVFSLVLTPLRTDLDGSLYDAAKTVENAAQVDAGNVTFAGHPVPSRNDAGVAFEVAVVQRDQLAVTANPTLEPDQVLGLARRARETDGGIYADQVVGRSQRRVYAEPATIGTDTQTAYIVLVSRSSDELQGTINRLILTLAAGTLGVMAVGGVLASVVVGRALRPVRRMAATAAAIGDRELDRRVENTAPDSELGELVDTFNGMLDRLQAGFEGLRRFTADASHELRAPLALMRNQVEVARSRDRSGGEYRELLARLDVEIRHLGAISDQLLLLARADANALAPVLQRVDVADLVNEEGQRWSARAAERKVALDIEAPDQGEVLAQPDLLRQVVDNLLDNALRHAPEASVVGLSARREGASWWFEVADRGPGVPEDLRPRLFRRFTRGELARDPTSGHAGLGLAVSAAIAESHGGRLELVEPAAGVADPAQTGAIFRLVLPAAEV